jgi:hypothetical protein
VGKYVNQRKSKQFGSGEGRAMLDDAKKKALKQ